MNKIIFILALLLFNSVASANSLDIWGTSYHTDRGANFNEKNYGIGYRHDFSMAPLAVGVLKDSLNNKTRYLGTELMFNDYAGVAIFLMDRPEYNGGDPFLAALPTIKLGVLRMIYIPEYSKKNVKEAVGIYFSIPLISEVR